MNLQTKIDHWLRPEGNKAPMVTLKDALIGLIVSVLLIWLFGCANGEPLPPIEGPWVALNPGRWQPSEAEIQQIKALPEK